MSEQYIKALKSLSVCFFHWVAPFLSPLQILWVVLTSGEDKIGTTTHRVSVLKITLGQRSTQAAEEITPSVFFLLTELTDTMTDVSISFFSHARSLHQHHLLPTALPPRLSPLPLRSSWTTHPPLFCLSRADLSGSSPSLLCLLLSSGDYWEFVPLARLCPSVCTVVPNSAEPTKRQFTVLHNVT